MGSKEVFLLELWQKCCSQHNLEAVITLLSMSFPSIQKQDIAAMSIGERNYLLYNVREKMFGKKMACFTTCPACNAQYQFDFSVGELGSRPAATGNQYRFRSGDYEIVYRLPNSFDLASASKSADVDSSRNEILRKCILELYNNGKPLPVSDLPEDIILKLSQDVSVKDQFLETIVNLKCENCKAPWSVILDISDFLLRELNFYAKKILNDIHIVASAYHWSEPEIMALSPLKRNWYINKILA